VNRFIQGAWAVRFPPVRRKIVRNLMSVFAEAFECNAPDSAGMSWKEMIETFGRFTRERTDFWIRSGGSEEDLCSRFFARASLLGKEVRARFRVQTMDHVLRKARLLYKTIGIDFQGTRDGQVLIRHCAFSVMYSETTCRVVSAFDEGFLYGLSEGMRLHFSRRITGGAGCCEAQFARETSG
jgi:hypothetical protein